MSSDMMKRIMIMIHMKRRASRIRVTIHTSISASFLKEDVTNCDQVIQQRVHIEEGKRSDLHDVIREGTVTFGLGCLI